MKKKELKYFISPEIFNKFFVRPNKLMLKGQMIVSQFQFHDVKLIKNIIAQELVSCTRPKISAVILKKKIAIVLRNNIRKELLVFLQEKPMIWSSNLQATVNVTECFFKGVFLVKNNKLDLVFSNRSFSKIDMMIKSAYFD